MSKHIAECTNCGIHFVAKRRDQKFHNEKCRLAYQDKLRHRKVQVEKKCPQCGTVFPTTMPRKQVYCLPECRLAAKKERDKATLAEFPPLEARLNILIKILKTREVITDSDISELGGA